MIYSTLVAALFAASAVAVPTAPSPAPTPSECKKYGADWKSKGGNAPQFWFTSTYEVIAEPGQVIGPNNQTTGGLQGALGHYLLGINSKEDYICWEITFYGIDPANFASPARTATHIHQANRGLNGPPRIAFSNAVGTPEKSVSIGCQQGPFRTGINATVNGTPQDTGVGFRVAQIEANPSNFFADVHTAQQVPGAVRGQLP